METLTLALLALAAFGAGLVDAKAATACAQAYRDFRRMQHVLRLNATRYARVEPETATAQRTAVRALWRDVFGAD